MEMTVLGFKITNSDQIIEENTEKLIGKIEKQKRIWTRYNLSLPGRINVCKTMFYSQLNYIGSVLLVNPNIIANIEDKIYNFVRGKLNIAKHRVFLDTSKGGFGLFDVKKFLDAQTCSWVRRCKTADQDWKRILLNSGTGTLEFITEAGTCGESFPILRNIAEKFMNFRRDFTSQNGNFMAATLLENKALTAGIRSREYLTIPQTNLADRARQTNDFLKKISLSNLTINGTKIPKREFVRNTGIEFDMATWRKLDNIRLAAITRYGQNENLTCQSFENFVDTWKRGSKRIRKILCAGKTDFIPHNIMEFSENTEIVINLETSKEVNKLWCKNFLSNDIRVFAFNLHNNTLPVNVILSHFARDVGRNCTFCDLTFNPEEEPETIIHLFFNCNIVDAGAK
jgi:hypothetical protein